MFQPLKRFLGTLAFSIPAGITLIDVVGYVAKVEGTSMHPVLNPVDNKSLVTDYVFLYNWPVATNSFESIGRGDIVALVSPNDPQQRIIKRVIGLGVSH
jgi:inner membrane protease subunit 2